MPVDNHHRRTERHDVRSVVYMPSADCSNCVGKLFSRIPRVFGKENDKKSIKSGSTKLHAHTSKITQYNVLLLIVHFGERAHSNFIAASTFAIRTIIILSA